MARQALAARAMGGGDAFVAAKAATARFYCAELLPQARGLLAALRAGAELLMSTPAEELARVTRPPPGPGCTQRFAGVRHVG